MNQTTIVSREFQVYKNGFFPYGRDFNGTCIIKDKTFTKPMINSNFDIPLRFEQDTLYSCNRNMTFAEFFNYCYFNKWENFLIFYMNYDIELLGKYGSSEIDYKSVNKFNLKFFKFNFKI